jgi:hypothetical protein
MLLFLEGCDEERQCSACFCCAVAAAGSFMSPSLSYVLPYASARSVSFVLISPLRRV